MKIFMVVLPEPDGLRLDDPVIRSHHKWTDQIIFVATSEGVFSSDVVEAVGIGESLSGLAVVVEMSSMAGWGSANMIQWLKETTAK